MLVVLGIAAVFAFVPESPVRAPGRVDLPGAALRCAGLVAVLLAISRGHSWGWDSPPILGLLAGAGRFLAESGYTTAFVVPAGAMALATVAAVVGGSLIRRPV